MLLLWLHRLALQLRPLLPLCYVIGPGAAAVALVLLLYGEAEDQWLSLALGLSIWALMLYAFIHSFQSIPPPVLPQDSFFERLQNRCRLALYHLLAVALVVIALMLVSMSVKLVSATAG